MRASVNLAHAVVLFGSATPVRPVARQLREVLDRARWTRAVQNGHRRRVLRNGALEAPTERAASLREAHGVELVAAAVTICVVAHRHCRAGEQAAIEDERATPARQGRMRDTRASLTTASLHFVQSLLQPRFMEIFSGRGIDTGH